MSDFNLEARARQLAQDIGCEPGPDEDEFVNEYILPAMRDALQAAEDVVKAESLEDELDNLGDEGYQRAVNHCADAIRRLRGGK